MRRSDSRILVTHVGALPAPLDVWGNTEADESAQRSAVENVVRQQREAGVDFVNEGEVTKGGTWVGFINARLSGFEPAKKQGAASLMLLSSADWIEFGDFYGRSLERGTLFEDTGDAPKSIDTKGRIDWACTSAIAYRGEAALKHEIDALKASLGATPVADAFLTSTAPMSVEVGRQNEFYASQEEFLEALAEALRIEYEGIAKAGLQVQIDDAWMAALWDRIGIPHGPRRVQEALHAAHRGAEPRPPQRAGEPGALPPVLGQLARAARLRRAAAGHRRPDARHQGPDLPVRGRERAPRARGRDLGPGEAAARARSSPPAASPIPPSWWSTPSWWPTGWSGSPGRSGGRTSSPPRTAVWACAATPRSPGRSSGRSRKGRAGPPNGSGAPKCRKMREESRPSASMQRHVFVTTVPTSPTARKSL